MSEFVFKNLTVKLMPETTDESPGDVPTPDSALCSQFISCPVPSINCTDCTRAVSCRFPSLNCGICSQLISNWCHNLTSIVCDQCTRAPSCFRCSLAITDVCWRGTLQCPAGSFDPCGGGFSLDPCGGGGSVIDPRGPIEIGDIRKELGQLKQQLRAQLQQVEAQEAQLAKSTKPSTVEEIDQLKEQLLGAVAELDAQRAQLQGEPGSDA